jgi:hypothetical protein
VRRLEAGADRTAGTHLHTLPLFDLAPWDAWLAKQT